MEAKQRATSAGGAGAEPDAGGLVIEIFDLRAQPRAGPRGGATRGLLARRVALGMRVRGLVGEALLLLLLLPNLFVGLRVAAQTALAPTAPGAASTELRALVGASGAAINPAINPLLNDSRWVPLQQRPFQMPALAPGGACPTTPGHIVAEGVVAGLGGGPVYAVAPGSARGALELQSPNSLGARGQGWAGQKVVWFVDPEYQGPILIRGRRLDGAGAVRFNGGLDQSQYYTDLPSAPLLAALRLEGDSSAGALWPGWPSYTRVRSAGCYLYQVDGTSFSELIVFQAVGGV